MTHKGNAPTLDWTRTKSKSGKFFYVGTQIPIEYGSKMEQVGALLRTQGKISNNTKGALARFIIETFIDNYLDVLNARS